MTEEYYPGPFFRITEKETGKSVRICFGNFLLDGFMRNFRRGSIRELLVDMLLKKYDDGKVEEEIKKFKAEVFEFVYSGKNRVFMSLGNGIGDGIRYSKEEEQKALDDTFKLNIYTGMALWELSNIFLKIIIKDRENKFSSETERYEEVENEILKVSVKLVNSTLDLIYGEYLPPEIVLKKLEIPEIRKLEWLRVIVCAIDGHNYYQDFVDYVISKSKENEERIAVKFRAGETRKYDIPAKMDTEIIIKEGLKNKDGPQVVVGVEEGGNKMEKKFYLFSDFTNRKIETLKRNIDGLFDKIVKQEDDQNKLRNYEITLANLRDELALFVFNIESEIKGIRRDYRNKINPYGECVMDEDAIEVSKELHMKFIELLENMRVLLFRYVSGGIKIEDLVIGYLEKRVALREYVVKEILKVDLSKCSVLDFINDKIEEDEFGKLSILKINDPKLENIMNEYIEVKKRLKEHISKEILKKGSVFDHLYVKFIDGTDRYCNPHDNFFFVEQLEKHIKRIKDIAEEEAKEEKDRNEAYKKACEEAVLETVKNGNCGKEMSFQEKLNRWKMNQKLLSPPDPEKAEKEWQEKIAKAKKDVPPDKELAGGDIDVKFSNFSMDGFDAEHNVEKSLEIGKKNLKVRIERIYGIIVPIMESKSRLTAGRYINFMTILKKSEEDPEIKNDYLQKVARLIEENVRPTENEFRAYIDSITVDEIKKFLNKINSMVFSLEDDKRRREKAKIFERFEKMIGGMKKDIEKIKRIETIFFDYLVNEKDIESAIKEAREELENL